MSNQPTHNLLPSFRRGWGRLGVLLLLLVTGCTNYKTHKAVRQAAEEYYAMLIRGEYAAFVDGSVYADSLPEDYRSQLVDAVAQTMAEGQMQHLVRATAVSDSLADSTAVVMLQLTFADSTREQVQLPLVLGEDGWRMQ